MIAIFQGAEFVAANYKFTDAQLKNLFTSFDTDDNGLIDALELFVSLALSSGMDTIDKIHFAFTAHDFDNAGSLSFDEANLLLRSVVKGMSKVSPHCVVFTAPTNAEIEKFTSLVFEFAGKGSMAGQGRVSTAEFRKYCSYHPVTSSWLKSVAQFPSEVSSSQDAAPLGTADIPASVSKAQAAATAAGALPARNPRQAAAIVSEEDWAAILAMRAAAAAEAAAKPKAAPAAEEGEEEAEEEDEEAAAAKAAAAALAAAAAADPNAPPLPVWAAAVDLMKPEELPEGLRSDAPEDAFEPVWVTGVNTARRSAAEPASLAYSDSVAPLMHRCVRYADMTPPPTAPADGEEAAAADGEEGGPPPVPLAQFVGSVATQLLHMCKEEEVGWKQRLFNEHSASITCMDVHYSADLLVTGDCSGTGNNSTNGKVVIWRLSTCTALKTIPCATAGVKLVDISACGSSLLVVTSDLAATVTMYDINSLNVLFARPLLLGPRTIKDCVTDIRFTGNSAMFAVSTALQGLTFYVEEGGSFMGPDALRLYEERAGLYQAIGRDAKGAAVTELVRFEQPDELVAGTEKGQLMLWRGRTCAQLLEAHKAAVTALDFNKSNLTLISGATDGVINIYTIASPSTTVGKGPQILVPRMIELSATFDIFRHSLSSYSIRSLSLCADSTRALLTTGASEVLEIALYIIPPTADELAEEEAAKEAYLAAKAERDAAEEAAAAAAAAAAEAGEEVPPPEEGAEPLPPLVEPKPKERLLGEDLHKAPILSAHAATAVGTAAAVTGLCRVPAGGFASCGADGSVRLWAGEGGNEETGAAVYKCASVVKMDSGCTAVDASATNLAVCLAGAPNESRNGSVHLFTLPTPEQAETQFVMEFKESTQPIACVKFSPEGGTLLAAASKDGAVYIYQSVEGVWSFKGVCGTASGGSAEAYPSKLDFSADGLYIRCFYEGSNQFRLYDVGGPQFGRDIVDPTPPPPKPKPEPVAAAEGEEGEEAPAAAEEPAEEDAGPTGPPLDILRGLAWASNSCAFNWDTLGAVSLQLPGATDRSQHLLLTATSSGAVTVERVPVLKFPVTQQALDTKNLVSFQAHLGAVSSLAFIEEGARLVTAGAEDGSLRVWKVTYDVDEFEPDPESGGGAVEEDAGEAEEEDEETKMKKLVTIYDSGEEDDLLDTIRMREHLSRDNNKKRVVLQTEREAAKQAAVAAAAEKRIAIATAKDAGADDEAVALLEADAAAADQLAAGLGEDGEPIPEVDLEVDQLSGVRVWAESLGLSKETMSREAGHALAAPPSRVPTDELQMHWVYGCSSRATRASVHYSKEGSIVYPAGTMGVIFDKVAKTQAYAMPHSDEITCLDVHPCGWAVSAHKGTGTIFAAIWATATGSVLRYLSCGEVNGVSAIKFSPDASHVVLTCQDADHTVMIFNTGDGRLRSTYRNGPKKPLCLAFSQLDTSTTPGAPLRILQGGTLHFKFLTFNPSRCDIQGKTGGYGGPDVRKSNVLCIGAPPLQPGGDGAEASGTEFLLGMADGTIGAIAKGETKVTAFTPVHKGAITALCVVNLKEGTADEPPVFKVVVGGTNGALKVLDQELQPIAEWNLYLNEIGLVDLGRVRGFKSLCVDKLNRKILYATAGGEVGEVELETGAEVNTGGALVTGHFRDQLHALAPHPLRQECATAGDDKTLRVWFLDTHKMATSIELPDIARAVTYSPNGHLLVAGLGGEVMGDDRMPREHRGTVVVISYLQGELRIVYTTKDAKDSITSVLFTPDGSKLLAASLDGNVYIYDALNNFQLLLSLTGQHKEGVRSMDMSESGQYVATVGVSNEYFIWDMGTAAVVASPKDRFGALTSTGFDWFVRQAPFGLNTVGVFPPNSDPADTLCVAQTADHKLLAAADTTGALKLFRNPACEYFAPYKQFSGHSPGGISNIKFTVEDRFLLSAGRSDRVVVQWRVVKSSDLPDKLTTGGSGTGGGGGAHFDQQTTPEEPFAASFVVKGVEFADEADDAAAFSSCSRLRAQVSTLVGSGNDSSSSSSESVSATMPRALFFGQGDLLTAHGKLPVLLDGTGAGTQRIVSTCTADSSLAPAMLQQVSAYAVTPSGKYAAIGHMGGVGTAGGRLVIVGAPSGILVSELSSSIEGGVTTCCFSEDGKMCACLGADSQHTLYVFCTYTGTWEDAVLLSAAQVSYGDIRLLSFIPSVAPPPPVPAPAPAVTPVVEEAAEATPPAAGEESAVAGEAAGDAAAEPAAASVADSASSSAESQSQQPAAAALPPLATRYDLVTAGDGHIKFWRISGQNLYCTCGEYGDEVVRKPVFTSLAALSGNGTADTTATTTTATTTTDTYRSQVVAGDGEGSLHFWVAGKKGTKMASVHASVVTAIKAFTGGFVTGSNDKLIIWSTTGVDAEGAATVVEKQTMSTASMLSMCGWSSAIYLSDKYVDRNYITAIDCDPNCQRLVLSFATSPIITVASDSRTVQKVSEGHSSSGKVSGVVPLPGDSSAVLTYAEDGLLRVWDVSATSIVGVTPSTASAAFNSTGGGLGVPLIGTLQLPHTPTAACFVASNLLLVAVSGADTNGKSGAILMIELVNKTSRYTAAGLDSRYTLKIVSRVHNVGTGAVRQLNLSKSKYLAAGSEDGCAYIYEVHGVQASGELSEDVAQMLLNDSSSSSGGGGMFETKGGDDAYASLSDSLANTLLVPKGFLLAHPSGAPVVGVDFSTCEKYARTFGENFAVLDGKVDVNYFAFDDAAAAPGGDGARVHAASKIQAAERLLECKKLAWSSISSAAAPEVKGVSYTEAERLRVSRPVTHISANTSARSSAGPSLICASSIDGTATLYRYPVRSGRDGNFVGSSKAMLPLNAHSSGGVLGTFTADAKRVVTVGQADGVLMAWDLEA
eukprot:CAMPEP_0174977188 /NCGR_PEP_ID=MMETSP0004_2-20121128/13465_1 /TAXON_ID=420556 /ORGANISM="Ochromonas sp., Strain CCMP1393" /LENGTH=2877 /DNA_ID=CAMNT_0016228333 /DNA_START=290 /DNA_END=8924 /DNA_ORIENTATION=-